MGYRGCLDTFLWPVSFWLHQESRLWLSWDGIARKGPGLRNPVQSRDSVSEGSAQLGFNVNLNSIHRDLIFVPCDFERAAQYGH